VIRTVDAGLTAPGRHRGAAAAGFVLLVVAAAWALTTDPIHLAPGIPGEIKGDDAVYTVAALSAAFDGNLSFERRDLERFEGLYHRGPEGIFLKRGKTLRLRADASFPFVHLEKGPDPRTNRLYFGKALIYPVIAAPFVRAFGLNGLLLLNVVLLAIAACCAYVFLAARSSPLGAALFTTAFFGATALPVYLVFWMPEMLNVTLVTVAYFLWAYREVSPTKRLAGAGGPQRGSGVGDPVWPQLAAAALLGLHAYSKPFPNPLMVAPLVLTAWWRREWTRGFVLGAVAVGVAALAFTFNAAVTGEFNYQGGDRKTFYGSFPFDGSGDAWDRQAAQVVTEGNVQIEVLTSGELPARLARNLKYFLVGRHFGFIPYFFPGVVAIVAWLFSSARRDAWRLMTFITFVFSVVAMLLVWPFTWSGGGGPTGNRYLLGIYPVLLFLMPPGNIVAAGLLAWLGGALFTAKILLNPLAAAKYPYLTTERGAARRLPVELSMLTDLPIMLAGPTRARIPYGHDPTMLLYFLDQNSFPPEPPGMWVAGGRRTDIVVHTNVPLDHLAVEAESPIATVLTVSMGAAPVVVPLTPGKIATFNVPANGVLYERYVRSFAYLLSASSSEGFVPVIRDPTAAARDYRNLGALMRFAAVPAATPD
jgi:hypothetical protein